MPLHNIIFSLWAVFWIYWLLSAVSTSRRQEGKAVYPNRGTFWPRAMIFLIFLIFVRISGVGQRGLGRSLFSVNSTSLEVIGTLLFLAGLALAIWARIYLGNSWGMPMTERGKTELVTSGPYSQIRHPIYTGILLGILGTALSINLLWFLALFISGGYFIYSATMEEKYLIELFPKEYPAYKKRTKMLLPFIL